MNINALPVNIFAHNVLGPASPVGSGVLFAGLQDVFEPEKKNTSNSRIHGHMEFMFNRMAEMTDSDAKLISRREAHVKLGPTRYRFSRIYDRDDESVLPRVRSFMLVPLEVKKLKKPGMKRKKVEKIVPRKGLLKWLANLKIISPNVIENTYQWEKHVVEEHKPLPILHFMRERPKQRVVGDHVEILGMYEPVVRLHSGAVAKLDGQDFEFTSTHPKLAEQAEALFTMLEEQVFGGVDQQLLEEAEAAKELENADSEKS